MRKITTLLTALSFAVLAASPAHADETTMVPPKKSAASTPKPKPKPAHPTAKAGQSDPSGHCMQGSGHMHKGMKGGAGMNGMGCSGKASSMKPKSGMKPMGGKKKMKPMGMDKPDMPMSDHDM